MLMGLPKTTTTVNITLYDELPYNIKLITLTPQSINMVIDFNIKYIFSLPIIIKNCNLHTYTSSVEFYFSNEN